jgi:hypothetical protein
LITVYIVINLAGCTSYNTTIVRPGEPFQVAQDVPNVLLITFDAKGNKVVTKGTIPAGTDCVVLTASDLQRARASTQPSK